MRHAVLALATIVLLTSQAALASCPEDLSGDGFVNITDLGMLLASWELDDGGDVDGDGDTDISDLGALLAVYDTPCPPPDGMVLIPAGEFAMGDHDGDGYDSERPVHDVYIDAIYMDVYETTNQQYCAYLNDAFPSEIKVVDGSVYGIADGENNFPYCDTHSFDADSRIHFDGSTFTVTAGKELHPMVEVSWYGAVAYANWRSTEEGRQPCFSLVTWIRNFDADGYRLPTEAEWEYAARGGEHDPYYIFPSGNTFDGSNANYYNSDDPYDGGPYPWTTPVGYYDGGQTPPGVDMANGYGLYDMAGNVREWCNDYADWDYYQYSPYDNPQGPGPSSKRICRGGSWYDVIHHTRCACRAGSYPYARDKAYGFRLVLDAE
jgi:formylglycine-generating enzyme required for sulfatase activity